MAVLIMPAAGSGLRFGADRPKQFLMLQGVPIIRRSLDAFSGLVDSAIIACSAAYAEQIREACTGSTIPIRIVEGGNTRQASVYAALRSVPEAVTQVLVHDAVRPFVTQSSIRACLDALAFTVGAVVAIPVSDTIKRTEIDTRRRVTDTLNRDGLWLAQTPQGLRRAEALAAFERAAAEGWQVSDDVQILERAGLSVTVVSGDRRNIKITSPEDWDLAKALLRI
jgi:2-C-methyl-D-erythritol 4-phosphate cytidylyltransferase